MGPITTVRNEHISLNALAVARVGLTTWKWFTESSRSSAVVLGNHPITSWTGLLAAKPKEELINPSSRAYTAILRIAWKRFHGKRQLGQIRHPL